MDDGGSRNLHYQMRRAEGASVPADRPWSWAGTTTLGVFRQLTNGVLYSFEVRAVNAEGEGPAAEIQATPGLPPSAPRNLTAAASHGQVTLEWEAPADRGSTAMTATNTATPRAPRCLRGRFGRQLGGIRSE